MKISIKNYFINGNIDLRLEVRLKQFFLKF